MRPNWGGERKMQGKGNHKRITSFEEGGREHGNCKKGFEGMGGL